MPYIHVPCPQCRAITMVERTLMRDAQMILKCQSGRCNCMLLITALEHGVYEVGENPQKLPPVNNYDCDD